MVADANVQFSQMGNFSISGRNGTNQIRKQNNINISGRVGNWSAGGHGGSTLTFKQASPALVSACKGHIWPLPHESSRGTKPKTSSSILINIKASISVCPLNTGQGSVRKLASGCLAGGNSPCGVDIPTQPRLEEVAVDHAPATWTQINQESRTEHALGSVTMTISYRSLPGELRSYIKTECARSPPTQIITLACN